jgi:hypothetical protein
MNSRIVGNVDPQKVPRVSRVDSDSHSRRSLLILSRWKINDILLTHAPNVLRGGTGVA